jgi:hypothetical protein
MQAVLYTHELEPITVLSIQPWLWQRLEAGEPIRLAVMEPVRLTYAEPVTADAIRFITVEIRGEAIQRGGNRTLMLFTRNEEHALLLKSDLLPGQRRDAQHRERKAGAKGFAEGFFAALDALGP